MHNKMNDVETLFSDLTAKKNNLIMIIKFFLKMKSPNKLCIPKSHSDNF